MEFGSKRYLALLLHCDRPGMLQLVDAVSSYASVQPLSW